MTPVQHSWQTTEWEQWVSRKEDVFLGMSAPFWYLRISFWLEKQLDLRHRQFSSKQKMICPLGQKRFMNHSLEDCGTLWTIRLRLMHYSTWDQFLQSILWILDNDFFKMVFPNRVEQYFSQPIRTQIMLVGWSVGPLFCPQIFDELSFMVPKDKPYSLTLVIPYFFCSATIRMLFFGFE